eukprot:2719801-Pleurochrysis_carterae.AAC.3
MLWQKWQEQTDCGLGGLMRTLYTFQAKRAKANNNYCGRERSALCAFSRWQGCDTKAVFRLKPEATRNLRKRRQGGQQSKCILVKSSWLCCLHFEHAFGKWTVLGGLQPSIKTLTFVT